MESAAMLATATDSFSDILATAMVLAATLIGHFTNLAIDGWCGILVELFICRSGYCAAKDTINPLLGQAPDKEFVHRVEQIVVSHEKILGVHDLIVHNYGPDRTLISLHAEVPADGDLLTLHDLIDGIEHELHNTLNCHAVIHMDPVRLGDQETARMQALVQNCLAQIDPSITMHDFHLVKEPSCTKLAFDVVVPYQFGMTDEELTKAIGERIQSHAPGYETVIEVDKAQL